MLMDPPKGEENFEQQLELGTKQSPLFSASKTTSLLIHLELCCSILTIQYVLHEC